MTRSLILSYSDSGMRRRVTSSCALLNGRAAMMALGHPRQVEQVFPGCGVDVEGLIAAHAFFHALDNGLRIAPHGLGRRGGLPADFIGALFALAGGGGDQRQQERDEPWVTEIQKLHEVLMR